MMEEEVCVEEEVVDDGFYMGGGLPGLSDDENDDNGGNEQREIRATKIKELTVDLELLVAFFGDLVDYGHAQLGCSREIESSSSF